MMDEKTILLFFLGALGVPAFTWWLVRKTIKSFEDTIKEIVKRQIDLREDLPKEYVRVERYRDDLIRLEAKLEKIFDKIDELVKEKQDKG